MSSERGQVLPLLAAGLATVVLALAALVLDVGHAYAVQRHLQAEVDAAALAGAQELPDGAAATAAARARLSAAGAVVTTRCLASTPACTPSAPNVLAVTESVSVATTFARVVGIDSTTVRVTSTASRAVSRTPLDVALVLDRTNSMTAQMSNLQAAVSAFLGALDPTRDQVALIAFPPSNACSSGRCDYYPLGNGGYVVDHLTSDFAHLRDDANRLQAFGSTTYKQALTAARAELAANGRAGSKRAIVFETDGAANAVPDDAYVQPTSWLDLGSVSIPTGTAAPGRLTDVEQPCGSAVSFAGTIGTPVYTVGFELSDDRTCYQAPHKTWSSTVGYRSVRETIDAPTALSQIAQASGGEAFLQEDGSKLASTFVAVATTIQPARLVPDDS